MAPRSHESSILPQLESKNSPITMPSDTELAGNSFTAKLLSTLVLLLLGLVYFYLVKPFWYPPEFPIINKYSRDWTGKKANAAFVRDARGLIHEGFRRVSREPFSSPSMSSLRTVLVPRSFLGRNSIRASCYTAD